MSQTDGANELIYTYAPNGQMLGVQHNGANYYYLKNLQGDVIGIYDSNANVVARYTYDAWGNILSVKDANGANITSTTHIANVNPIRYRGYYYDTETKLYYLQSRYYNPEWGRFINADDSSVLDLQQSSATGTNLYAYCNNNPVINSDPSGYLAIVIAGATISISVGAVISLGIAFAYLTNSNFRNSVNSFVNWLLTSAYYMIIDFGKLLSTSIANAKTKVRTSNTQKHHIIAQRRSGQYTARYIYTNRYYCDMNINGSLNLVKVNQNLHYYLHNSYYDSTINWLVSSSWNKAGKAGVLGVVLTLHLLLKSINI